MFRKFRSAFLRALGEYDNWDGTNHQSLLAAIRQCKSIAEARVLGCIPRYWAWQLPTLVVGDLDNEPFDQLPVLAVVGAVCDTAKAKCLWALDTIAERQIADGEKETVSWIADIGRPMFKAYSLLGFTPSAWSWLLYCQELAGEPGEAEEVANWIAWATKHWLDAAPDAVAIQAKVLCGESAFDRGDRQAAYYYFSEATQNAMATGECRDQLIDALCRVALTRPHVYDQFTVDAAIAITWLTPFDLSMHGNAQISAYLFLHDAFMRRWHQNGNEDDWTHATSFLEMGADAAARTYSQIEPQLHFLRALVLHEKGEHGKASAAATLARLQGFTSDATSRVELTATLAELRQAGERLEGSSVQETDLSPRSLKFVDQALDVLKRVTQCGPLTKTQATEWAAYAQGIREHIRGVRFFTLDNVTTDLTRTSHIDRTYQLEAQAWLQAGEPQKADAVLLERYEEYKPVYGKETLLGTLANLRRAIRVRERGHVEVPEEMLDKLEKSVSLAFLEVTDWPDRMCLELMQEVSAALVLQALGIGDISRAIARSNRWRNPTLLLKVQNRAWRRQAERLEDVLTTLNSLLAKPIPKRSESEEEYLVWCDAHSWRKYVMDTLALVHEHAKPWTWQPWQVEGKRVVVMFEIVGDVVVAMICSNGDYWCHTVTDSEYVIGLARARGEFMAETIPDYLAWDKLVDSETLERLQQATEVVVAPVGVLWSVPFHALATPWSDCLSGSVVYAPNIVADSELDPCAYALENLRSECKHFALLPKQKAATSVLSIGISLFQERDVPLQTAESEALIVGDIYGVRALCGKDASRERILEDLSDARLLHWSTHTQVESDSPFLSRFMSCDSSNDVTIEDIMHAEFSGIAVLHCCRTAKAHQVFGETAFGFAYALLWSGARAVVAAQWELEDSYCLECAVVLHSCLASGATISEAVREASMHLRNMFPFDSKARYPLILLGDPQARVFPID